MIYHIYLICIFYSYFINFYLRILDKRELAFNILSTNENIDILGSTNKEHWTNDDNDIRIVDLQGIYYTSYNIRILLY